MIPRPWIAARSGSLVGGNPPTGGVAKSNEVCARPSKRGHFTSDPRHLPSHTTDNPATEWRRKIAWGEASERSRVFVEPQVLEHDPTDFPDSLVVPRQECL